MPDRGAWRVATALIAASCAGSPNDTPSHEPVFYEAASEFSLENNPNGPWAYGYTATDDLGSEFRVDGHSVMAGPMGFWHPSDAADGYYPYVAFNPGQAPSTDATGGWALRTEQVALEAANDGRYAAVRFEAPIDGLHAVHVTFEGVHFGLSTTSVHVRHGEEALFDALIDGYGGDPAFHDIVGDNPSATYDGTVLLAAGDSLLFAVGVGANGTHYSDTTAATVSISAVPWEYP